METHTILTVGFVVLAVAAFVAARAGAVAIGVLPDTTEAGDANARDPERDGGDRTDEGVATASDDAEEWEGSRITAADRERVRKHLEKDPFRRSPDDLLPSDGDDEAG